MEVVFGIIGLLNFVAFILLVVGMFKPSLLLRNIEKPTRIKVFGIYVVWLVVAITTMIFIAKEEVSTPNIEVKEAKTETPKITPEIKEAISNPKIEQDVAIEGGVLHFIITTNIPLPVNVNVSIDLKGQKPDDTYIGTGKHITLTKSPQSFDYNISTANLPNGEYEAVTTFYPNWGAKEGNPLSKNIKQEVVAISNISYKTGKGSVSERKEFNKKQLWVMENVIIGTKWNESLFKKKLGSYQELKLTGGNPNVIKAYYFQSANMTIFVNKLKKEVATWRKGKDSAFL